MKERLVTVPETAGLADVERTLAEAGVSGSPVVDSAGRVVGVVTMRDLVALYASEPDARPRTGRTIPRSAPDDDGVEECALPYATTDDTERTAADLMTRDVAWVTPDADLGEVAAAMARNRVHRVLVRDGERFVGLIGTLDVLDALAG
jgi:CBS domain-containing protein